MTRRRLLKTGASLALGSAIGADGAAASAASGRPSVYEALGVKQVINATGTVTILGGSIMPPEVVAAWADASRHFVNLSDLQDRVGERIAKLIGVEAAMVTTGAAGALLLIWLWHRYEPRYRAWSEARRRAREESEAAYFARVEQACRSNNAAIAYRALGAWVRRTGVMSIAAWCGSTNRPAPKFFRVFPSGPSSITVTQSSVSQRSTAQRLLFRSTATALTGFQGRGGEAQSATSRYGLGRLALVSVQG